MKAASKPTKNISRLNSPFILWLQVFVWCGVIFYFSSIPNYSGRAADFETALGILKFLGRKFCHLSEYAILMVLTRRAIEGSFEKPKKRRFLFSFLLVLFYSVTDEWHQSFVFGRNGTPLDVFIDSLGALAGAFYEKENQSPAQVEN